MPSSAIHDSQVSQRLRQRLPAPGGRDCAFHGSVMHETADKAAGKAGRAGEVPGAPSLVCPRGHSAVCQQARNREAGHAARRRLSHSSTIAGHGSRSGSDPESWRLPPSDSLASWTKAPARSQGGGKARPYNALPATDRPRACTRGQCGGQCSYLRRQLTPHVILQLVAPHHTHGASGRAHSRCLRVHLVYSLVYFNSLAHSNLHETNTREAGRLAHPGRSILGR